MIDPSIIHIIKRISAHDGALRQENLPPVWIDFQRPSTFESIRQLLVFENLPSLSARSQGKGMALMELADGRAFFFRTSMAAIKDEMEIVTLADELRKQPEWITDWDKSAGIVSYAIGAPFEFIDNDPSKLDSWNIEEWKKQAASWMAINRPDLTIQQMNSTISETWDGIRQTLSHRLNQFIGALDQFAWAIPDKYHCSWQSSYNFFSQKDEQRRKYRRQVDTTFPLVIQQIFSKPNANTTASIIQAIDEGVPLVDFLAKLFDCPKKCVRHLNGLRFEDIGERWGGRINELLRILSRLDVNRLPSSAQEWVVFGETLNLLLAMTKMPITALSNQLLIGEISRQSWRQKPDSSVIYQERAQAIERFSDHVRQAIVATAWMNGKDVCVTAGSAQRLALEVACSLGLSRLEMLARKWRAQERRLDSENLPQQMVGFPVILEEPLEVGDEKVIQLTDSAKLSEEGRRMSSCVGGYGSECADGRAYIFSVRSNTGESCVTVEYSLNRSDSGLPQLLLVQEKGRENSRPNPRYHAALKALKDHTLSPSVRMKLLDLTIQQRVSGYGGSDVAKKYLRHLTFTRFLENECPGRFDFDKFVNEVIVKE